ncbi:hypothetical protein H2200_004414 [Cladophialophora chaetospira]|uniref:Uncharacterized protein n=1 Tax=Cladophialophora chaetospira TaxID=386627 RepID=A0AA38XD33_9EURO|nr:hypothetical protein H2200_004414 [Cladophialophora chaetospira]
MGNTQSQEGDPVEAGTEVDPDDQEFDLSKIPDDRESAERDAIPQVETDLRPAASPANDSDGTQDMARRTNQEASLGQAQSQKRGGSKKGGKKNKRRNRKTASNNIADSAAASETLTRQSPAAQSSADALEDSRPLKETEPETYHIYATSDQSDVEAGRIRTKTPLRNGFTAVNRSSQKSPTRVRRIAANEAEDEDEDAPVVRGRSPEPDAPVEALGNLASIAEPQPPVAVLDPQSSTKVPEPRVNDQGRFLCPFADIYRCTTTLAHRKGAMRHAKGHLKNSALATEPAIANTTSPQETTAAPEQAFAGTSGMPASKINSDGRFPCPFAEAEGCLKTFSDRKGAVQHAKIHTNENVCFVCNKKLSRQDKLLKHMKQHSGTEIAIATNANAQETLEQIEDASEPDMKPDEPAAETNNEDAVEPEDGDSTEFATPQGTSPLQDEKQQGSVEKVLRGAQDVVDSEMVDAKAEEEASENAFEAQSTTPPSVFDEEETIVKETPMLTGKLKKRKRAEDDDAQPSQPEPKRTGKRRKASPSSPPTSVPSNDVARPETPKASSLTAAARRGQLTDKIIPRLQSRQGSMDGWAQKFTAGSGLKHPSFNPTPPRPNTQNIQVVIPRTSQGGPSGTNSKRQRRAALDGAVDTDPADSQADSEQEPTRKKSRKATYATSKGKNRAEPGVEYSTPAKDATTNGDDDSEAGSSDVEETSPVNIATSVAKRTFPRQDSEEEVAQEDDQDSDFDVTRAPESEDEAGPATRPVKSARPTKRTRIGNKPRKSKLDDSADRVECIRCHKSFASEDSLRKHQEKPSAHVGLLKCQRCSEEFYATAALARHEKDTGHGKGNGSQGRIGAFSQNEVNKLNRWRHQFCEYHNITEFDFNEMMTDTLERGQAANWRWTFVKRAEFLKEYVNVLPSRNKRSMLRYRERNFQNLEGMKNWTAEDDSELVRLQKELGSKWSEISRRLGRNVDAVSQRWRHKLRYGDVETGEWSRAEDVKFRNILNDLRGEEDGDDVQDHQIPWNKVSEQMGTRSAQQCSNHYRAMHSKKQRGKWVKIDALEKKDGSSRILTPSKMELRLSGKQGRRSSRKGLSEKYIQDDDDDGDDEEEEAAEDEVGETEVEEKEASEDEDDEADAEEAVEQPESEVEDNDEDKSGESSEHEDTSSRPTRNRNPLPAKTPGKTLRSSQLFEQTQANTSALKPSQNSRKRKGQPSQDRPSPNIPIQRRRGGVRSPLEELPISPTGKLEDRDEDVDEVDKQEDGSSQELRAIAEASEEREESEAEGDEVDQKLSTRDSDDDDDDDDESTKSDSDDEKSANAKVEASDDEASVKNESDEEEEAVDGESEEVKQEEEDEDDGDEEQSADVKVAESTDDEETQSAEEDVVVPESPSASPSPSDSGSDSDSDSDDDSDAAAPEEQTTSSFMASINESAKRANIKKVRSGGQMQNQRQNNTQSQALKGRADQIGRGRGRPRKRN